jgi:hypothetical protein
MPTLFPKGTANALRSACLDCVVIDRAKLARILAMLGAQHDGEVLAAARAAHRMILASRLTWAQVLDSPGEPEPPDLDGAWLDLRSRDEELYLWVMSNFELNPVAHRLWSNMGNGQCISDIAIGIARFAMRRGA